MIIPYRQRSNAIQAPVDWLSILRPRKNEVLFVSTFITLYHDIGVKSEFLKRDAWPKSKKFVCSQ
jgi:hypothetical protein